MLESLRGSGLMQGVLLGAAAIALIGLAIYLAARMRRNPKDREKRRRLLVNQQGRLGDATITEVSENTLYYEYSVRGVLYTASQDVEDLREQIASELERLIGPVSLKYSSNNPANSIILCEGWSGLRKARSAPGLGARSAPGLGARD
jgi:hypothetical protein